MNTRLTTLAAALALACLSGCAQTSPNFDKNFGTSLRASLAAQVIDPAAARSPNPNPVTGLDGRAAAAANQHYEASFAHPVEQRSMISGQGK
ncbi:hypothetical protein [Massilia sp. TSP1-1-2]|uniref:hypothetical protein n=1 Tax=unclassified Massilia TaxID=2609279 RepID=UPI003CF2598B